MALSSDPEEIAKTDAKVKELIHDNPHLHNWLDMAAKKIKFQGLAGSDLWVGLGDRDRLGLAFNEIRGLGRAEGYRIVIGRDRLDPGSVASPNRETEAMRDGSDAVSDWPLLNALALSTASGATWVSAAPWRRGRHGEATPSMPRWSSWLTEPRGRARCRLKRVPWNDPATGVMRHADAGYDIAVACARERGLDLPSLER